MIKFHDVYNNPETSNEDPIKFSRSEMEVLQFFCEGYTKKNISEKLSISPRAIEGNRLGIIHENRNKRLE